MAQFDPIKNRALAKKLYLRLARWNLHLSGLAHIDWTETYLRDLEDEIDGLSDAAGFAKVRDRIFCLRISLPPVAWVGA